MKKEFSNEIQEIQAQQKVLLESVHRLEQRLNALNKQWLDEESLETVSEPIVSPPPLPSNFKEQLKRTVSTDTQSKVLTEQKEISAPQENILAEAKSPSSFQKHTNSFSDVSAEETLSSKTAESFEFKLGRVWLVRVAVVLFLTGLVLLGNLTYQHFITQLSPMIKAFILYIIAGGLIGLGLFLEKWKESLRNYGHVILGTGLAAVYYTTYASHFVLALRWIESVSLVAFLLLACAGAITWMADWKKSQTLGNMGLILAYYSCIIQPATWFTLASNLVLAAAAVTLWQRHGWSRCSWVSLIATYGTFLYWQTPNLGMPAQLNFHLNVAFLLAYWILFTTGVFLCRPSHTKETNQAAFLTLNNMAFYGSISLVMPTLIRQEQLWLMTILYGGILGALGILGVTKAGQSKVLGHAYMIQGLLFLTTGICLKLSGYQLAILLVLQSFTILAAAREPFRLLMKCAAGVLAFIAFAVGMLVFIEKSSAHLAVGIFVGLVLLLTAWWQRNYLKPSEKKYDLQWGAFYFVGLALLTFLTVSIINIPDPIRVPALALIAVALLFIGLFIRLPELSLGGQSFIWAAMAIGLQLNLSSASPWWSFFGLLASILFLSTWWEHHSPIKIPSFLIQIAVFLASGFFVLLLYGWLDVRFKPTDWLMYGGVLTFSFYIVSIIVRNKSLALFTQVFLVISVGQFFNKIASHDVSGLLALLPIAATLAMSVALRSCLSDPELEVREPKHEFLLRGAALIYRLLTMLMVLFWIQTFISDVFLPGFLGVAGLICIFASKKPEDPLRYGFGALLIMIGLVYIWFDPVRVAVTRWTDLLVIVAPALLQQLDRRQYLKTSKERWREVLEIGLTLGTLWLFISRFVMQYSAGFYLSVSWSLLALVVFGLGLVLKERIYRLAGLAIVGCTLGRIVFIDLWQFGTLSRILSLMVSGAVLGVLGYIYNRYAESIKKYL